MQGMNAEAIDASGMITTTKEDFASDAASSENKCLYSCSDDQIAD